MKKFFIKSTPWLIFALLVLMYCLFALGIIATTKYFSYITYSIIIISLIINIFDTYYKPKIQFGTLIVALFIFILAFLVHVILSLHPYTIHYEETDGGIKITGYTNHVYNDYRDFKLELPDEIDGKKVVSIGKRAFYDSDCFGELVIPKYVKEIEESAFESSNISDIKLNEGLETIGKHAFAFIYNKNFSDFIIIPSSVNNIGFYGLYSPFNAIIFQNSTFKEGYENIMDTRPKVYFNVSNYQIIDDVLYVLTSDGAIVCAAQASCEEINILEEVAFYDISYEVKTIGKNAFFNTNLKKVKIANTITNIEDHAFSCCTELDSIIIPKSVVNMGENVFYNTSLKIYLEDKSIVQKWNNTWHFNNELVFLE